MDPNRNYFAELAIVWIKVGAIYLIVSNLSDASYGLFAAGLIFGLTFFNKVVRFNLFGNHDAVILFWILKVLLSATIGIIAFPIVNAYYIINIIMSIRFKLKDSIEE